MLKHIAVGIDLSSGSNEALGYAVTLARRNGAKVTMISVTTLPPATAIFPRAAGQAAELYTKRSNEMLASHRAELEALRERVAGGASVEISTLIVPGFADRDVATAAEEIGADMVVVGTHGRGFLGRIFIGSVAERTARSFNKSVLVTRGDHHHADGGFRRILVATDLSPPGEVALDRALEIAAPGASIELVHAWRDPLQAWSFDPAVSLASSTVWSDVETALMEELKATVAKSAERASHQPPIAIRALLGYAGQALVARAHEMSADAIVVGAHSHRGVARFLLGSTAEAVLRHAPCSVLIAR
ncbi:MAG: universal stress protein [Myxococcales bacterium]|nr:universal stress protein [Myxococcales bacterium]